MCLARRPSPGRRGRSYDCEAVAAAREAAREDDDGRIQAASLCGFDPRRGAPLYRGVSWGERAGPGSWARMIEAALGKEAAIETMPAFWNGEEEILRFVSNGSDAPAAGEWAEAEAGAGAQKWSCQLGFKAPHGPKQMRSSRSRLRTRSKRRPAIATPRDGRKHGAPPCSRGRLIHLLLQYLPGIAAPNRRDCGAGFPRRPGRGPRRNCAAKSRRRGAGGD